MEGPRTLTIISAAVLVGALTVTLVVLVSFLLGMARQLRRAHAWLAATAEQTGELAGQLEEVCEASARCAAELAQAQARLQRADQRLALLVER